MPRARKSLRSPVAIAILLTIGYTDQFHYPLTKRELWTRLLGPLHVTPQEFTQVLAQLVHIGELELHQNYYTLPGRGAVVSTRRVRQVIAEKKWQEVERVVRGLQRLPWVEAVLVTGSLAMSNADEPDDLDFALITSLNRLWLTRVLVTLFALWHGKRRSWQGEEARSWCFNLWLDTSALAVKTSTRNVYLAYEVVQAVPVYERHHALSQFYLENAWVSHYIPMWRPPALNHSRIAISAELTSRGSAAGLIWRLFRTVVTMPILDVLENFCWMLQQMYMQRHQTSERVSSHYAFFHPRDTRQMIVQGWQKSLRSHPAWDVVARIWNGYAKENHATT